MKATLNHILNSFDAITLGEMGEVRLMNRIDTKFVTTTGCLVRLLEMAGDAYLAQDIDGARNMRYDTTYFDTAAFDMYSQHQHGHANRQKIRFRRYVSSQLQFLEVKTKNNHGRTKKKRMEADDMNLMDTEKHDFLEHYLHYDVDTLIPAIQNSFDRITLVNRARTERLTIDTGLRFHNLVTGHDRDMGQLVVVELKRDGLCPSPVLDMLRRLHIHPHGFSKYCMGSALTNEHLCVNRFKRKLIEINKIVNQQYV